MRQSLGNGGGQSPSLRHFASPALRQKAGGVRGPATCPPCSPNPRRGRAGAAVPARAQGLSIPGVIWGRKMKPEPQPCSREPPRGAGSTPRGPAQGTLLPRGGMWGQPPLHQGRGVSGLGTSRLPAGVTASPSSPPDRRTDGRGTGSIPHASRCRCCSPCCDRSPAPPAPPPSPAPRPPARCRLQHLEGISHAAGKGEGYK